jgi:competence protein ComEA
MFKKFLAFLAALSVFAAFAAVDVNKASEAELDGIKGIGPATTRLIVAERQKAEFKSWEDFISRVRGIGPKSAAKFSAEGMTISGTPYQGIVAVAKTEKPAPKADTTVLAASSAKK